MNDKWKKAVERGEAIDLSDLPLPKIDIEEVRFKMFKAMDKDKVHYCPDWDFMAIHADMPEFRACLCYDTLTTQMKEGLQAAEFSDEEILKLTHNTMYRAFAEVRFAWIKFRKTVLREFFR